MATQEEVLAKQLEILSRFDGVEADTKAALDAVEDLHNVYTNNTAIQPDFYGAAVGDICLPNGDFAPNLKKIVESLGTIGEDSEKLEGKTLDEIQSVILSALQGGVPESLNTLSKLATSINNDPNFISTISTALANKYSKSEFTGAVGDGALDGRYYAKSEIDANIYSKTQTDTLLDAKQRVLNEGSFQNGDKTKLDGIATGAKNQIATEVPVTPNGNMTSTNVQAALEELQNDVNNAAVIDDTKETFDNTWSGSKISSTMASKSYVTSALDGFNVSPVNKPVIISPTNGTTDFIGSIVCTYGTTDKFVKEQDYVKWLAGNSDFSVIYDSYEGSSNLLSWTPNIGLPLKNVYVKVVHGSDGHRSIESDTVMFTTPNIFVQTPTITINGEPDEVAESPTITLSDFAVYNGSDIHESSSYKITKVSDGSLVHQSLNDETNLLTYTVPAGLLETDTDYVFEAWQTGETYGNSTAVSKTITTKETFKVVFGRIWNVTADTYKRYKYGMPTLSAPTELEFSSWLSPTDERVNDDDTSVPSDLTTELDTNVNLPFANISRKVVDTTSNVTAFDHSTAPAATEQIMTQIEKTYYIQALVVADGNEYDIQLVSTTPFTIDVVNDLGFTTITSITCFNPTAGISSGTVAGNVISSAIHPAFVWHDDSIADLTFIGSFPSISGRSTFGADATSDITISTARTQHTSFGTNFNQHDIWNNFLLQILAYVERGTNYLEGSLTKWDGYARSGLGESDVQNTGLTLSLQNKTGVIKDGSSNIIANSYRGIENYHSNLRMWIDGININATRIYLAKAGSAYASDTDASPYFDSGYNGPSSSGNIEKWQAGTFIPDPTTGGDSTTQVTDYMYGSATGFKVLFFGGILYNPGLSGLSSWSGNNDSTTAAWTIVSRSSLRKFF